MKISRINTVKKKEKSEKNGEIETKKIKQRMNILKNGSIDLWSN